jgi:hypothetical protein
MRGRPATRDMEVIALTATMIRNVRREPEPEPQPPQPPEPVPPGPPSPVPPPQPDPLPQPVPPPQPDPSPAPPSGRGSGPEMEGFAARDVLGIASMCSSTSTSA